MNREWVLHHLGEAREAISSTIADLQTSRGDYREFWLAMQLVYHHLNTAWNAREATPDEVEDATDDDFNRWGEFPSDLPMMKI